MSRFADKIVPTRRTFLCFTGVCAGGVILGGCNNETATPSATPSTNDTIGNSTTPSDTTIFGRPSSPQNTSLVALSDVPLGGAISVTGPGGEWLIVSQPTAGAVIAFSARCTHQGCIISPAGKSLDCPCHGSSYDYETGAVLAGPAVFPLPAIAVIVADAQVVLE